MEIATSIIVIVIPFAIFVLWAGFLRNFELGKWSYKDVGVFTFIYVYAVLSNRLKFRRNGKSAEIRNNKRLKEVVKEISEIKFDRKNDILGMKYVKELNEQEQEKKNKAKTEREIMRLLKQQRQLMVKHKPYDHIEKQIKQLEKTQLVDNEFVYYSYNDIVNNNVDLIDSTLEEDGSSIKYKVEMTGFKRTIIFETVKGIGIGSAVLGLAWGLPLDVTITYISFLVAGIVITALTQTFFGMLDTRKNYLK